MQSFDIGSSKNLGCTVLSEQVHADAEKGGRRKLEWADWQRAGKKREIMRVQNGETGIMRVKNGERGRKSIRVR